MKQADSYCFHHPVDEQAGVQMDWWLQSPSNQEAALCPETQDFQFCNARLLSTPTVIVSRLLYLSRTVLVNLMHILLFLRKERRTRIWQKQEARLCWGFFMVKSEGMCSFQCVQSILCFPSLAIPFLILWKITVTILSVSKIGSSSRAGGPSVDTHCYIIFPLVLVGKSPCHLDLCQHQWKAKCKWQIGCYYQSRQTSVPTELALLCCCSKLVQQLQQGVWKPGVQLQWVLGESQHHLEIISEIPPVPKSWGGDHLQGTS